MRRAPQIVLVVLNKMRLQALKKGIQTPMAQGRSTKIIKMI